MNKIFDKIQDSLYIGWLGEVLYWVCGLFAPVIDKLREAESSPDAVKEAREQILSNRKTMGDWGEKL